MKDVDIPINIKRCVHNCRFILIRGLTLRDAFREKMGSLQEMILELGSPQETWRREIGRDFKAKTKWG